MARTKPTSCSYSAGEKGRNRVRVFADPKTGVFQIEWSNAGQRRQRSLKHRDLSRAKQTADEVAAGLASYQPPTQAPLTLQALFEMYLDEVTPTKGVERQKHDRRALNTFLQLFGRDREPKTLSKRDFDRFCRERAEGSIGPSKQPVSARAVEYDLRTLLAVFNWAVRSNANDGTPLLDRNPLAGLRIPAQKNPNRPVLTQLEYEAMLSGAPQIDWRFELALVLAHETGHRIGAIRQLRWSDIDLGGCTIRWRGESEKTGREHTTPITPEAVAALQRARKHHAGIGEAPVLPAPGDPNRPVGRYRIRDWWRRAEKLAGLEPTKGRGWHSCRRKFASDHMHVPLKVLCQLGGWKSHETVVECYQHPDEEQLREALNARKRA